MIIKAGLKKEFLSFSRPFRMWIIVITIIAFSAIDPLLLKVLGNFANGMTNTVSNVQENTVTTVETVDVSSDITAAGDIFNSLLDPAYAVTMTLSDLTGLCFLILMILLMPSAGGELKKRATIIPNCSGLTPGHYLIPKFIFYPLFIFVLSFVAVISSGLMTLALLGSMPDFGNLLITASMTGVYMIFSTCLFMCLGISTSRAGAAVAITYVGKTILEVLFAGLGAEKFNPFALRTLVMNVLSGDVDTVNILGSIGVTLVLSIVFFFITLMVLSAKRIDNMGEESGNL